MNSILAVQGSFHAVQGSILDAKSSFLAAVDQFMHYAAAHRTLTYIAIGAALLIIIPLGRMLFSRGEQTSMSLNSSVAPLPLSSLTSSMAEVAPIHGTTRGVRCIHCDAGMSAGQDFCPACGYAQPVLQTGTTARFPG